MLKNLDDGWDKFKIVEIKNIDNINICTKTMKKLIKEAKNNIVLGEPEKLLNKKVEEYMYMSSMTYYNWFNKNFNLNNFPILSDLSNWIQLESINIPILTLFTTTEYVFV